MPRKGSFVREPEHLLDLVRQVKPRAVLLTTYTFSVSHFDAVLLPALRSAGCQDIAVLVDADEAALCSQESRSRSIGRLYRMAPVKAPGGGVFHPKLAYLATDDNNDVLAVGSGNLTASGQSLQLESFDSLTARQAPSVFLELAHWFELLASLVAKTSVQASVLLAQTAPRARQAGRLQPSTATTGTGGAQLPPRLIHTLSGTAREALQSMFRGQARAADSLTVLSPFHSPDGGPLQRLAGAVRASRLDVGLDGGRSNLVAPFDSGRFKPAVPTRFVLPDVSRNNRRLHAKVFELRAADQVLVMTGSVNATAQSLESSQNVEVSLARWLQRSPFEWRTAEPTGYEPTLAPSQFEQRQVMYVDAWLEDDRMLHGQLSARVELPSDVWLVLYGGETELFSSQVQVDALGHFELGPVPGFETSQAVMLTVTHDAVSASCWLNIHAELELAMEERERHAAIGRVLRGQYATEDIVEVIRLLSTAAQGLTVNTPKTSTRRQKGEQPAEGHEPFSFLRWRNSGRQHGGPALLGRNPYELLKALNLWMNADLTPPEPLGEDEGTEGGKPVGPRKVRLQVRDGDNSPSVPPLDAYAVLDQLCVAIPLALEQQPRLEVGPVLAEVVASRAVGRTLKQEQGVGPCLAWLDRFSRFEYPPSAHGDLCSVAAVMACIVGSQLEREGKDPQMGMLREAVERFVGRPLSVPEWKERCQAGLARELYRRAAFDADALQAVARKLATAQALEDSLLALLTKGLGAMRLTLSREPEALVFPDVATTLRQRRLRRRDLQRGVIGRAELERKGLGCPFCYQSLTPEQLSELRRKRVLVHKGLMCNNLLLYAEAESRLTSGLLELPDA